MLLLAHKDLVGKNQIQLCRQQSPRPQNHPYHPMASRKTVPHPSTSRAQSMSPLSSPEPGSPEPSSPESHDMDDDPSSGGNSSQGNLKMPNRVVFAPPIGVSGKMRFPHPKGAGRRPLLHLVKWEQSELQAMKVCISVSTDGPSLSNMLSRKVSEFL